MNTLSFADFTRCVTRPLLTVTGLLAWIIFIVEGTEYPEVFQWVVVAMVLEWFSERAVARVQGRQP